MFHSNNRSRTRNRLRAKYFLGLATLTMLSACTTLPQEEQIKQHKDVEKEQQAHTPQETKTDLNLGQSDKFLPSTVDPMADVKISNEVKDAYIEIASATSKKNYDKALGILSSIKMRYPKASGPSYQTARVLLAQKKHQLALDEINQAVSLNPKNYYAYSLKGIILREMGKFNEAKKAYLKAISVYPNFANGHLNLGVLADLYLRDLNLALVHYENYMALTAEKDKKVSNWIVELKRRISLEQNNE